MYSDEDTLAGGLPHSEIPGSTIARISPGLFAACHVLHRLSVPRHPPDALLFALERHTQRQAAPCRTANSRNRTTPRRRSGNPLHLKTLFGHIPFAAPRPRPAFACRRPQAALPGRARPRSRHNSLFTYQSANPRRSMPPPRSSSSYRVCANQRAEVRCRRSIRPLPDVCMVEVNGIEPMTSCLQSRRSPN
jgi:hypothetical protein